jgi:hypothetical protein
MKNKNTENKESNKQNNKEVKLPNFKKPNNIKPFLALIVISLLIAFLVPYLYKGQLYIDEKVSLNNFVKSYNS